RPMPQTGALLLEQRQGGRQLPDQGFRKPWTVRLMQDLGQTLTRRVVRNDGQAIVGFESLDGSDPRERRMPEAAEILDPVGQCLIEPGGGRKLGADPEQLERRRAAVVEHEQAVANTVGQALGVPAGERLLWRRESLVLSGGWPCDIRSIGTMRSRRGQPGWTD